MTRWTLMIFLTLCATVPYSRGSDVNEYHFFGIEDIPNNPASAGVPTLGAIEEDHFHIHVDICAPSSTTKPRPPNAHGYFIIPDDYSAPANPLLRAANISDLAGTGPPLDEFRTPSGLSPPPFGSLSDKRVYT